MTDHGEVIRLPVPPQQTRSDDAPARTVESHPGRLLAVVLPDEPLLTPAAAAVLLRMLLTADRRSRERAADDEEERRAA